MKLLVDALEAAGIDVRVALCRGNAGVAEHFLHVTKINTTSYKMCGKTMPQGVGRDIVGQPCLHCMQSYSFPDAHAREPIAP